MFILCTITSRNTRYPVTGFFKSVDHMDKSQRKWLFISVGFSLLVLVVILFFTINENTLTYYKRDKSPGFCSSRS